MIHAVALAGTAILIALAVFFWKRNGVGSGRGFGNRVAAHIEIPRSLFHSLLDHGVTGSSRELLASLEKMNLSLEQASVELGPALSKGIERLEARFGKQDMVESAKPIVARLASLYKKKP